MSEKGPDRIRIVQADHRQRRVGDAILARSPFGRPGDRGYRAGYRDAKQRQDLLSSPFDQGEEDRECAGLRRP